MKIFIKEDESKYEKRRKKSNYGMNMLQLNPNHFSGVALFELKVAFRQLAIAAKDQKLSDHLDIEVQFRNQEDLLAPDVASRIQHNIMWYNSPFGNNKRLALIKINALGYVKSHICYINDPAWIERLQSRLVSDPNDGGLKDARHEDSKIIISDSTLRSLLPS